MELQNLELNPELKEIRRQLDQQTEYRQKFHGYDKLSTTKKVIPVVFHILHQGGTENITMEQIRNQVAILNEEFNRMQADTNLGPADFQSLGGRIAVEFRLATKDPDGNCTQGVTRTYSALTKCIENPEDAKYVTSWPSNKYLNVWLVKAMRYQGQTTCSGGGYAQFPGGGSTETDGVEIRNDLIGSIGTSATNTGWGNFKGRYLIHELGHWFNLIHIWGDQTCGNDLISDTPPAEASNSGCPSFPWHANNSCGSDANGEMFNNYMDYSQGACLNIFTKQQAVRMDAALNAPAGNRNKLWQPANLTATGTDTVIVPDCPAKPELFPYATKILCGGGSVTFKDFSWGGTKTSRLWTFPGGSPATSTDSIVTVTYSTPGNYDVTLSNSNANGTESKTFPKHVVVLASGPSSQALPAAFDFEGTDPLADWIVLTPNGGNTWIPFDLVGYASNKSVRITNSQNKPGQFHELITPSVDLTNHTSTTLKYNLMYRSKNSFNKDKLVISFSKDCGLNWTTITTRIANTTPLSLNTMTTNSTGNYIPLTDADWRIESVNIPSNFISNNFRVRFSFTTSGGNNIYIDNVRFAGTPTTGLEDPVVAGEILLFPNPAGKEVFVQTNRGQLEEVVIRDVTGKEIKRQSAIPSLNEPYKINTTGLQTGLYVFELTISGNKVRKQVVVKE